MKNKSLYRNLLHVSVSSPSIILVTAVTTPVVMMSAATSAVMMAVATPVVLVVAVSPVAVLLMTARTRLFRVALASATAVRLG